MAPIKIVGLLPVITLTFKLPEFSTFKDIIDWQVDIYSRYPEELSYDMVIGRDQLQALQVQSLTLSTKL